MAQLGTQVLPLLPLTTGVVLPGMVVTLTIESDDARRAVAAAERTDGELLLVPRTGQRVAPGGPGAPTGTRRPPAPASSRGSTAPRSRASWRLAACRRSASSCAGSRTPVR